jgi:hypothetical protein
MLAFQARYAGSTPATRTKQKYCHCGSIFVLIQGVERRSEVERFAKQRGGAQPEEADEPTRGEGDCRPHSNTKPPNWAVLC